MRLLIGREWFHETLDLVQGTFCHVLLLPKDNVYCLTRSPHQEACPLCGQYRKPNAGAHLLPEADARHKRTLKAVR